MATLSGNTAEWFTIPGDPGPIGWFLGLNIERSMRGFLRLQYESNQFIGFAEAPFSLTRKSTASFLAEALVPLASG